MSEARFLSPLSCLLHWVAEGTNQNSLGLCPNLCSSGTFFLHTLSPIFPGCFILVCFLLLVNGLRDLEKLTQSGQRRQRWWPRLETEGSGETALGYPLHELSFLKTSFQPCVILTHGGSTYPGDSLQVEVS